MRDLYEKGTSGPWIDGGEDTQWKWWTEGKKLIIAFQGSVSREDWMQNFSFWMRPYKDMPVTWLAHAGFVKKWKAVEDEVLQVAKATSRGHVEIFGFSQGGAIAQLCHEAIKYHYPLKQVITFTFGSPRVFWWWRLWKIKNRLNGIFNFTRHWDLVPHLPPAILGYVRVGDKEIIGPPWWKVSLRFKNTHMGYDEYIVGG